MAISGVTDTTTLATGAQARASLSDNFDTFLVLLTAQLQNQDPLSPMDSTEFTNQLVQYSQVEQQIRTNDQLDGLVAQYQAASAGAALAYLGREAIVTGGTTNLKNSATQWGYILDEAADKVTLTIKDAKGQTVLQLPGDATAGTHVFNWNGKDANGNVVPDGQYRMVISARNEADEGVKVTTTVREEILGVDFSGASPKVITQTGTHDMDEVHAILDDN